jgi:adenylate cyclase
MTFPALGFRRFQSRILFFFLSLFTIVLILMVAAVTTATSRSASEQVQEDLLVAERVFQRFLDEQVNQLILSAKLLSGDFAFKQAYAESDRQTLLSAVANLREHRIGADIMIVVDADDYTVLIDTQSPEVFNVSFPFPELIERAEDSGEPTAAVETLHGRLYRLVLVPLLAPEPVAWIAIGFVIDDALARSLKALALVDVSFLRVDESGETWVVASSLPASARRDLRDQEATLSHDGRGYALKLENERFLGLATILGDELGAVLLRSLDEALEPSRKLYRVLLVLAAAALGVTALCGVLIARTVTRPVRELVDSTRLIAKGDYHHRTTVAQHDELGELADAFSQMTRGLAAFQRYVPTDLVRTLISRGIESKPVARVATMLFTDIEGFTALGERLSPGRLVAILNEYFSAVTPPIHKRGGVIIQYQGDAMLAVFNVPDDDPDHPANAVRAALEIQQTLAGRRFAGNTTLTTRIGINTGNVIAGSVGSEERVNYTVHGDAVNLAARLENLNKDYETRILLSQATADGLDSGFPLERIGEVLIRGKQTSVTVYSVPLASGHEQGMSSTG